MKKLVMLTAAMAIVTNVAFAGLFGGGSSKLIQLKGSDTILNLTQKVTEDYLKANPKARISVTGGGSGTGIAAIINKTVDIAMSSRDIKESELEDAKKHQQNAEKPRRRAELHPADPRRTQAAADRYRTRGLRARAGDQRCRCRDSRDPSAAAR